MVAFLVRLLTRLLYRVEVRGRFVRQDKMLIVANHQSFIDGILLGAYLPIWPTYLVHSDVARIWYFKLGLRFLPHLVVDSKSPLAMKAIIQLLDTGTPVVIFPEGRITITGSMMKVYDGPAFVAAKSGAAVLPVHLDGPIYTSFSKMKGDFPLKTFPKFTITIGTPKVIEMPEGKTPKIRRRLASEQLRRIMQNAAFEARTKKTLYEAMLDAVDLYGRDRKILEDIRLTEESYAHMIKASLALGRIVSKLSAESECVGVLMPNASPTVYLLYGMFAMRRTPAMLNYTAGVDGMQSAIRLARVKTVITSRAFVEKARLGNVVEQLKDVRVVYLEDLRATFGLADKLWLILYAVRHPRSVMKKVNPDDPAVILFTSGSEGKPKGVVLSHDSIMANTDQIRAVINFTCQEKFLSALPLFHAFGLMAGMVLPLTNGCRTFIYPSPLHYRVIPELVYDRDLTVVFATNTFLLNYAKAAHPYDFARLKYIVVGAEKLTDDVQRMCLDKFGIRPLEGYGATECSPVLAVNTPLAYKAGTVGELLPGIEHMLEPIAGIENGGALHVRGPSVMLGYLDPEGSGRINPPQSAFGSGWYNTGDVVVIEDTGFVRIQGRIRRFAKVAGEMVSLEIVEKIATAAQPKYPHASTSIKDPSRGEIILLFTQDPLLKREQLQAAAREMGAPELAIPRRIIHVDKIPLLGNGKRDYVTIGKMATEMAATPAARS